MSRLATTDAAVFPDGVPLVAVLPTRYYEGLESLAGSPAPGIPLVTLEQAYARHWDTDAHALLYLPQPRDPADPFLRCNKSSLPSLRAAGLDLVIVRIFVEADTPGHVPWTPELWQDFEQKLAAARRGPLAETLGRAAAFFGTRKGVRWGFELSRPVPVDEGEPLIRGLVSAFRAGGIDADDKAVNMTWTQPFRLPCVLRDGRRTEEDPFYFCELNLDRRLDPSSIVAVGKPDLVAPRAADETTTDEGQPMPEEAAALVATVDPATGCSVPTAFFVEARDRLVGRQLYPYVFEGRAINLDPGTEYQQVRTWAASAVSMLHGMDGVTAAHVHALLLRVVGQLDDDGGRRNWARRLWRLVTWAWARESAQSQAIKEGGGTVSAQQSPSPTTAASSASLPTAVPLPIVPSLADDLATLDNYIGRFRGREFLGMPQLTLPTLDRMMRGLRGLVLLAAPPNVGKTALAVQLGIDVVRRNADACFVFLSLEMRREEVYARILSRLSSIDFLTLMRGGSEKPNGFISSHAFSQLEQNSLAQAKATLAHLGKRVLLLDAKTFKDSERIDEAAHEFRKRCGASRVFAAVDYLQVFPVPEQLKIRTELEADKARVGAMKTLRDALGEDSAVLVISEARKPGGQSGEAWGGSLADIMGSARGSYTPDAVLLLRPFSDSEISDQFNLPKSRKDDGEDRKERLREIRRSLSDQGKALTKLEIAKGRDGVQKGVIDLTFDFWRSEFSEGTTAIRPTVQGGTNTEGRPVPPSPPRGRR